VGRGDPHAITIFKSHGMGLEDVAVAALVYEKALQAGVGRQLDLF